MPMMDGFQLYDKMKDIDNKVKVCFITAYEINYQALRKVFPTLGLECFIQKPIEISQLLFFYFLRSRQECFVFRSWLVISKISQLGE
jgi:CheY-like chemotaxis protein